MTGIFTQISSKLFFKSKEHKLSKKNGPFSSKESFEHLHLHLPGVKNFESWILKKNFKF